METWKDVVGYAEILMISSSGRLFSKRTKKILSHVESRGYLQHVTRVGGRSGKAICLKLHRLVAEAFIENPDDKPEVNHKDGNKTNNRVENLEWCTGSENLIHAVKTGLLKNPSGLNHPSSVLTEKLILEIKKRKSTGKISNRQLAEIFLVSRETIRKALSL